MTNEKWIELIQEKKSELKPYLNNLVNASTIGMIKYVYLKSNGEIVCDEYNNEMMNSVRAGDAIIIHKGKGYIPGESVCELLESNDVLYKEYEEYVRVVNALTIKEWHIINELEGVRSMCGETYTAYIDYVKSQMKLDAIEWKKSKELDVLRDWDYSLYKKYVRYLNHKGKDSIEEWFKKIHLDPYYINGWDVELANKYLEYVKVTGLLLVRDWIKAYHPKDLEYIEGVSSMYYERYTISRHLMSPEEWLRKKYPQILHDWEYAKYEKEFDSIDVDVIVESVISDLKDNTLVIERSE